MGRVRIILGTGTLVACGFAAGCGGASEAGPRLKPAQPRPEMKIIPEAASNAPARVNNPAKPVETAAANGAQYR
jgi:hypothetical protein